jgi:hypothetical protein
VYAVETDGADSSVSVSIEVDIVGDAALKKEMMVRVIYRKATEVGGTTCVSEVNEFNWRLWHVKHTPKKESKKETKNERKKERKKEDK